MAEAKTITRIEAIAALTKPGERYELQQLEINGVSMRAFKNAPSSLRALYTETQSEKPFIVYDDDRLTFAEAYRDAARVAHILVHQYGVTKGDRVAISMRNYPEWVLAFMAATSIGAIAVPMNAMWQTEEMDYALEDCGAKLLFADQERLDRLAQCSKSNVRAIAVRPTRANGGAPDLRQLLQDVDKVEMPPADVAPEDAATIFYTSGSTGDPKGVVSTATIAELTSPAMVRLPNGLRPTKVGSSHTKSTTSSGRDIVNVWMDRARRSTASVSGRLRPRSLSGGVTSRRTPLIDQEPLERWILRYIRVAGTLDSLWQRQNDVNSALAARRRTTVASQTAQLEGAKAALERAKLAIPLAEQRVKQAESTHESARQSLGDAQKRLTKTDILSPINGVVADIRTQIGEVIQGGKTTLTGGTVLAVVLDMATLVVRAEVDESDIGRVLEIAPDWAIPGRDENAKAPDDFMDAAKTMTHLPVITVESFRDDEFIGVV
ncbi:MAG: AMP-binding protein, partial [Chloroflexi bacterium]|nr:AMP-binding protein [Chloroflexota bacterium]